MPNFNPELKVQLVKENSINDEKISESTSSNFLKLFLNNLIFLS